ncbi:putative ATP-dependent RNA helicase DHR2 [Bienertia sinuspersici]
MKRWSPDMELHKENVKTVPIWIRMPNLDLKCWGHGCLHKLGDNIGTTIKVNNITLNKDRLSYAHILVEVELDKELPDYIRFQNEKGILIQKSIEYEWRPTYCAACNKYGHPTNKCNKQIKKQWQPKVVQTQHQMKVDSNQTKAIDTKQLNDEGGQKDTQAFSPFQRKSHKPADQVTPVTPILNSLRLYQIVEKLKRRKGSKTLFQQLINEHIDYFFNRGPFPSCFEVLFFLP